MKQLNESLPRIAQYSSAIANYALSLNIAKSKALIMGSSAYVNEICSTDLPRIIINGTFFHFSEVKNLGVVFQSNLSWRGHVPLVLREVNYSLYRLKHHKNLLTRQLRIKLITKLVFSLIYYCCLVFHDLTDELNSKLLVFVNNSICFTCDLRRNAHITPYKLSPGWLTVKKRYLYFLACTTYRIHHTCYTSYLRDGYDIHWYMVTQICCF